jgi:ribonuclease-3
LIWFKKIKGLLSLEDNNPFFVAVYRLTGLEAKNLNLYQLAFKHKSKNLDNNERLEFLGDSILGAVVSEIIYKHFPFKNEGELSMLRSKLVSRSMLNYLANKLGLLQHLSYRATHTQDGLQNSEGNALEALIGAIYLDKGYSACQKFIRFKLIEPHIDWQRLESSVVDHKSLLYTYCQKENKQLRFLSLGEDVKNFDGRFHIALKIDGLQVAEAKGKSKKIAEQKVSKIYLEELGSG